MSNYSHFDRSYSLIRRDPLRERITIEPRQLQPMGSACTAQSQHEHLNVPHLLRKYGKCGLRNLGNTCYMNSAVQCLLHSSKLVNLVLKSSQNNLIVNPNNKSGTKGKLLHSFTQLALQMWTSPSGTVINPSEFKNILSAFSKTFQGYRQHDAQEALSAILDGLHEDVNRVAVKKYVEDPDIFREHLKNPTADLRRFAREAWHRHLERNDSPFQDLCHGLLYSQVICSRCDHLSARFDPFSVLSLSIPLGYGGDIPLESLLSNFSKSETLSGDDQWYCSKCKKHRDATKRMFVVRLPELLIVHLKRFTFSHRRSGKNTAAVTFNPTKPVDLSPLFLPDSTLIQLPEGVDEPRYNLFATLNHWGSSVDFGHYTATARTILLDQEEDDNSSVESTSWRIYDDSDVRKARDASDIVSNANYLLFFESPRKKAQLNSSVSHHQQQPQVVVDLHRQRQGIMQYDNLNTRPAQPVLVNHSTDYRYSRNNNNNNPVRNLSLGPTGRNATRNKSQNPTTRQYYKLDHSKFY